jgi:hypothetical protein
MDIGNHAQTGFKSVLPEGGAVLGIKIHRRDSETFSDEHRLEEITKMLRSTNLVSRVVSRCQAPKAQNQRRQVHAYTSVGKRVVTLIPGDGIGPEITASVVGIIQASGAPVEFERFDLNPGAPFPEDLLMRYSHQLYFVTFRIFHVIYLSNFG